MLRQSQLKGRSRLRGLLADHRAAEAQMTAERERFAGLADPIARPSVFSSFNLFPTPPQLARQVCRLAWRAHEPVYTHRVLEPSAGTGNLITAAMQWDRLEFTAVEIDPALCDYLAGTFPGISLHCRDFLEWQPDKPFDRVIMNPPFKQGRDIKHIEHAATMLAPGGRLVAICASGPRQREALQPLASEWHELPPGSFKGEGTNVNAVIVVFER